MAEATLIKLGNGKHEPLVAGDTLPLDIIPINADADNALVSTPTGLKAPNSSLTFDPVTSKITFTDNKGATQVIDLSQFLVDIHVESGTFDTATTMLTLTTNDGQEIKVNLGDLAKSAVQVTTSVKLEGDGSAASPLKASLVVSEQVGNAVEVKADGVYVGEVKTETTTAPAHSTGSDMSTNYIGGRDRTLGQPAGFIEFPAGSGQKIPFYN